VQAAEEVTKMVALLKTPPTGTQTFSLSPMYPSFAAFAAFYGQATDALRYNALHKLLDGCELWDLVSLNDRAFLFYVYVNMCANMESESKGFGAWYFNPNATMQLKVIRKWMITEEKSDLIQGEAVKAVKEHLEPIKDLLPPLTNEDNVDAGLDTEDTDSD